MQQIVKVKRVANPRRKRKPNPLRVVTLGRQNPRRKKKMATTSSRRRRRRTTASTTRRRRSTTVTRRRRRNPVSAAPSRRRRTMRRNPVIRRRTARRNPSLFGRSMNTTQIAQAILGGLIGVTATKLIPANLPPTLVGTPIMRIVSSAVTAFASGWVAGRFSQPFGDAVMFGGLMQAGSVALNAFIPSVGSQIGLNGLGDLVSGGYPVPQNPIMAGRMPMVALPDGTYGPNAPVTMSGLSRAFGRAI